MALLPCPWCGGSDTRITENYTSPSMTREPQIISADLYHWCNPERDSYVSFTIHIRARTSEQAENAWNARKFCLTG